MADAKLSALTADTAPVDADLVYTVDDVAGTPTSKKVTLANFAAAAPFSSRYAPLAIGFIVDYVKATRTSGDATLNSTSWANVDTGLDLTLTGVQTGDEIEVLASGLFGTQTVYCLLDVATIVAGSPVNYIGSGTSTPTGVTAWNKQTTVANIYSLIGGGNTYTLQAGDISGGNVVLRLRYQTGTATNLTFFASSSNPFRWWAKAIRV